LAAVLQKLVGTNQQQIAVVNALGFPVTCLTLKSILRVFL
jgi:hypothetical protein